MSGSIEHFPQPFRLAHLPFFGDLSKFLSDPSLIIDNPCHSLTHSLTNAGETQGSTNKIGKIQDLVPNKGSPKLFVFFFGNIVYTKTSKNAVKHIILSFKMKGDVISDHFFKLKGDVISDHFLMLWFQKDSLDTVGGGSRVPNQKVTKKSQTYLWGGGGRRFRTQSQI